MTSHEAVDHRSHKSSYVLNFRTVFFNFQNLLLIREVTKEEETQNLQKDNSKSKISNPKMRNPKPSGLKPMGLSSGGLGLLIFIFNIYFLFFFYFLCFSKSEATPQNKKGFRI